MNEIRGGGGGQGGNLSYMWRNGGLTCERNGRFDNVGLISRYCIRNPIELYLNSFLLLCLRK